MKEKLQKRIIELIHGLPYLEAIEMEREIRVTNGIMLTSFPPQEGYDISYELHPITIGRVMQALRKHSYTSYHKNISIDIWPGDSHMTIGNDRVGRCAWYLTKENGQECDLNDQSEETISALYNILQ